MKWSKNYNFFQDLFPDSLNDLLSREDKSSIVRKTWSHLQLLPSTSKNGYTVVDGKPGFTKEALDAIAVKAKDTEVLCNIVIGEMCIREEEIFNGNRFYGGVDMGTGLGHHCDSVSMAKAALVFMAVSLNDNWEVPVGYFLINCLCGEERANLLLLCLELMNETAAKVYSITFDSDPVYMNMCTSLGANFDINSPHFQPWFLDRITGGKIYTFWDPCHMVKLVRNTLGDLGSLIDSDNSEVSWKYIRALNNIQKTDGLVAATKLTDEHINYNDNRMSVRLAVQTLSASVYNALRFVDALNIPDFKGSYSTALFCNIFNNIFDILNVGNTFGEEQFKIPLREDTIENLKKITKTFEEYVHGLKDQLGTPILQTERRTGFLGLIICLRNILELYKVMQLDDQQYLSTSRISHYYIETYFGRGRLDQKLNAQQFESAYKRLLVRHELNTVDNEICLAEENEILHVSTNETVINPSRDDIELNINLFDHDYI